jgi:hypothetical protein
MVTVIAEDVYACEDCTLVIANGEFDESPNGLTDSEVNALQIALWGENAGNMVIACQDDEDVDYIDAEYFKGYDDTHKETIMTPYYCDACGRMMHGEFHLFAILSN